MNSHVFRLPSRWIWGALTMAALLAGCGGGDDPMPAASLSGATVGPVRAANCQSVATTLVPACPAGTAASLAQLTAIIGTYGNSGSSLAQQLFISNRGTAFYGTSPTEHTPTSMCTTGGGDVVLNFTPGVRLVFVMDSTSVTASGNAPTSPPTPMNNVPQSSCQY